MQKIFYENSYKKEFVAEIIDIYPEGGGQLCD